jgi:DNA-binding IclR family transcriptional regulator
MLADEILSRFVLGVRMETAGKEKVCRYELQVVNQAMDLMDVLIQSREAVTLSSLSRIFGQSKNKIFRILSTLEHRGLVEKDCSSGYRLGGAAFGTAHRILASHSVLDHAMPIMTDLAAELNEAVYLATMMRGESVFRGMVDCHQSIRTESFVGRRFSMPDPTLAGGMAEKIDVAGAAMYVADLGSEVRALSASLVDSRGTVTGALVVLAPLFRMSIERIKAEIANLLGESVQRLSLRLAGDGSGTVKPDQNQHPLVFSGKRPVIITTRQADDRHGMRQCHH